MCYAKNIPHKETLFNSISTIHDKDKYLVNKAVNRYVCLLAGAGDTFTTGKNVGTNAHLFQGGILPLLIPDQYFNNFRIGEGGRVSEAGKLALGYFA